MSAARTYSLGIQLYRQGRFDEAVAALATIVDAPGLTGRLARYYQGQACREEGLALARMGKLQAAQEYLQRTIKLVGRTTDLAGYLARIYTQMGLHHRAEAQLDAAAASTPDSVASKIGLARAQARSSGPAAAIITLHQALRQHPDSAELRVQIGLMFAREDRMDLAAAEFAAAIQCDSLHPAAHYCLGLAHAALGDMPAAVRHLQRAAQLAPDDVLIIYQLATAARAAEQMGCPVQLQLIHARPQTAESDLLHLAELVTAESDFVSGILHLPRTDADDELFGLLSVVLDTALQRHPHYADLHLRQALVHRRLKNLSAAAEHARAALRINPRYRQAWIVLGHCLADEKPEEALGHLQRAVREGAHYPDVHFHVADLLIRLDRTEEARAALETALSIKPDYKQARQALRRLAA